MLAGPLRRAVVGVAQQRLVARRVFALHRDHAGVGPIDDVAAFVQQSVAERAGVDRPLIRIEDGAVQPDIRPARLARRRRSTAAPPRPVPDGDSRHMPQMFGGHQLEGATELRKFPAALGHAFDSDEHTVDSGDRHDKPLSSRDLSEDWHDGAKRGVIHRTRRLERSRRAALGRKSG
jgi:hypothetical protein